MLPRSSGAERVVVDRSFQTARLESAPPVSAYLWVVPAAPDPEWHKGIDEYVRTINRSRLLTEQLDGLIALILSERPDERTVWVR